MREQNTFGIDLQAKKETLKIKNSIHLSFRYKGKILRTILLYPGCRQPLHLCLEATTLANRSRGIITKKRIEFARFCPWKLFLQTELKPEQKIFVTHNWKIQLNLGCTEEFHNLFYIEQLLKYQFLTLKNTLKQITTISFLRKPKKPQELKTFSET